MPELRQLERNTPDVGRQGSLPPEARVVNTPLQPEAWSAALRHHPDREYVSYLVQGIQHGFRIGFDWKERFGKPAKSNMLSAEQNPEVVDAYLAKEVAAGRVVALSAEHQLTEVHISRFGVIPKPHQPGKWRLIVDMSHPKGSSINDGISPELCSLAYASIDDAVKIILQQGRGAELAKLDVANAYRIIPVHPEDRSLLGMRWKGKLLIDTALPFGLRSASKIFTAVADGLQWILSNRGVGPSLHYLDDFLFVGPPQSSQCRESLQLAVAVCQELGVPLASDKLVGPIQKLQFLGITLDTVNLELHLPAEKLVRLKVLVSSWRGKRSCRKRELLSLIGHLQHATRVVKPGRSFLRRMIDLAQVAKELHHHIRLSASFRSDLEWWAMFLSDWNGVSMMASLGRVSPEVTITSDASGKTGCGAFSLLGKWFQGLWHGVWQDVHITVKELLPIVIACAVWGHECQGKTVRCLCDNAAVVAIIRSGTCRIPLAMHLMRTLFFFTAHFQISLVAEHIPGHHNEAADAISRNNLTLFYQQVPGAEQLPTPIPQELWEILVTHKPDWTSINWRAQFSTILRKD